MIDGIKRLLEVQEEHSHRTALLNAIIVILHEIYETCGGGIALPEPRLATAEYIVIGHEVVYSIVGKAFQDFA